MYFQARYYPLVNGNTTEYRTVVNAPDRASAETYVRTALAEQMANMLMTIRTFNLKVTGYNIADLPAEIEYARTKMRVVIE